MTYLFNGESTMSTTESRVPRSRPKPAGTERVIPSKILTALCRNPEYAHLEATLKSLPKLVTIVFGYNSNSEGRTRKAIQIKNTAITFKLADFNTMLSGCKYFLVKDDDPESFALETDIADATITERYDPRGGIIASTYTLEKNGSNYTLKARHCVTGRKRLVDDAGLITEPASTSMTTIHVEAPGEEPARKRRRQTIRLVEQPENPSPAEGPLYSPQTGPAISPAPLVDCRLLRPLSTTAVQDQKEKTLPTLASVLRFIGEKPGRPDLPFSSTVPPITPITPAITVTPVTPIPESLRRVLNL